MRERTQEVRNGLKRRNHLEENASDELPAKKLQKICG